ncbi:MAG: hypothetical protein HKO13_09310 [Sphingomonas sp.]|nr:hypothetical protein [Sphingomonas sp.]
MKVQRKIFRATNQGPAPRPGQVRAVHHVDLPASIGTVAEVEKRFITKAGD